MVLTDSSPAATMAIMTGSSAFPPTLPGRVAAAHRDRRGAGIPVMLLAGEAGRFFFFWALPLLRVMSFPTRRSSDLGDVAVDADHLVGIVAWLAVAGLHAVVRRADGADGQQ